MCAQKEKLQDQRIRRAWDKERVSQTDIEKEVSSAEVSELQLQPVCYPSQTCKVEVKLSLIWLSGSDAQTPCQSLQIHPVIPFACFVCQCVCLCVCVHSVHYAKVVYQIVSNACFSICYTKPCLLCSYTMGLLCDLKVKFKQIQLTHNLF